MPYITQRLAPEHRAAVLRLWKDNMSDSRIGAVLDERYQWLYDRNPAGPPITVLALQSERSEAVGCGSVYPRRMQVAGAPVLAAVPADFAVDRKHRLGGAALMIQRALVGEGDGLGFFFGFPNKSSLPILQRVGYKPIGAAQGWVKPLRAAYKVREYVKSEFLAGVIAAPADLYLAGSDATRASGSGTCSEVCDRADERFDRLWERARAEYGFTGERTSEYLNWRYAEFTTRRHRFFCLTDAEHSSLLGYAAFTVTDGKVSVVDLFAIDMAKTAETLLMAFARRMRSDGCDSIFLGFAGHPDFAVRLRRLGFYPRGPADRKLVALASRLNAEQEAMLFDSRNWYMFDGEMDI